MLRTLDFSLGQPLPLHFLRRNSRAGHSDGTMHTLAKYFMELTVGSSHMLSFLPSEIAAAATYMSREVVGEEQLWNPTIEFFSDYKLSDVQACITEMKTLLANSVTSKYQAVRTKFSRSKFMRISKNPALDSYIAGL